MTDAEQAALARLGVIAEMPERLTAGGIDPADARVILAMLARGAGPMVQIRARGPISISEVTHD